MIRDMMMRGTMKRDIMYP